MDLTIKLEDATLNIRVAILLKSKNGYIFEKHQRGYLFTIGGRVKLNESSMEAAIRELKEELFISDEDFDIKLKPKGVIENFYKHNGPLNTDDASIDEVLVHEICFVYEAEGVYESHIRDELFLEVTPEDFAIHDIKPKVIVDLINDNSGEFRSLVVGK